MVRTGKIIRGCIGERIKIMISVSIRILGFGLICNISQPSVLFSLFAVAEVRIASAKIVVCRNIHRLSWSAAAELVKEIKEKEDRIKEILDG